MDDHEQQAQREIRPHLAQYAFLIVSIILAATLSILQSVYSKEPEPYHTLILRGEGWVLDLLTGHLEHIRCKLGIDRHVFLELISELFGLGHTSSRFVSLEEQLSIFLYTCVTGLTIHHTGEWFQRSNETISQ